jgi:hypothetical protein
MAHRHLKVVFLLVGFENRFDSSFFAVHVRDMPLGGFKYSLDRILIPNHHKIDHVPEITRMVVHPPRQGVNVLAQVGIENEPGQREPACSGTGYSDCILADRT